MPRDRRRSRRLTALVLFGAAVSGFPAISAIKSEAGAAAQSSRPIGQHGRASDWELDFRPGPLRVIVDPSDAQSYWYFTYKVINRSGRERMWAPRFELFTDRGEIHVSGREIPTRVTTEVMKLLGNPLLVDQNQIIGEILVGEEHAKEGVVIFPADPLSTELTVFVSGASGRVRKVEHPKTGAPVTERWTIRFNYQVSGDGLARGSRPVPPATADQDIADGAQRRTDWGVWLWR